jgi:hypothetical protein
VIQLRISLVFSSATGLAWTPGRMRLVDQTTGRDIALRQFAEFLPADRSPASESSTKASISTAAIP